ncbi:MAG: AraC family transcriptional regulator [Candidatus Leucobacter sulfamidivorax]|nr:AraC family transcriptional regulator [Candidatus Leucobacter sulfamidivorax]
MRYIELSAPSSFPGSDAVLALWYLETPRSHPFERVLPLPSTELIVNLSDPYEVIAPESPPAPTPQVFLTGVRDRIIGFRNPRRLRHFGMRFSLEGVSRIGVVPGDGVSAVPDGLAQRLLAEIPRSMRRGPLQSGSPDDDAVRQCLEALARVLAAALEPESEAHRTVRAALGILTQDPTTGLGGIADGLGISHKTLISRFRSTTGSTPSRIARLLMVHRLLGGLPARSEPWTWTEVVAESPFADQSHFIRAFRRATGLSPREYLAALSESSYDTPYFIGSSAEEAEPEGAAPR